MPSLRLRPVHYAASSALRETAASLERWFFLPVSPHHGEQHHKQSVLGVVKAAEYLGLRWRTDPVLAAQYAALLEARYGTGHDAYRPAFPVEAPVEPIPTLVDAPEPLCYICIGGSDGAAISR